jgi:hypothetical protein
MQVFNLTLTAEHMKVLNDALVNMPYKQVVGLIHHINDQLSKPADSPSPATEGPKDAVNG